MKNAPDDFCAAAWLCTEVNGRGFRADAGAKAAFLRETLISDNGERARSLLCGREALVKPPGAAVYLLTLFYPAFVKGRKKISTRRNLSGCRA